MSLIDKLKFRRRKKRKTGKLMRHFRALKKWSRYNRARARHHAQVLAIRKLKRIQKERKSSGWPDTLHIVELYVNDNGLRNHVHVASTERDKLIQIANIARSSYSGGDYYCVREFPPFDPVECVHTSGSWHYRDSGNPYAALGCGQGDGLAFDLRSPQSIREAFAHEVKRRYGADSSDI